MARHLVVAAAAAALVAFPARAAAEQRETAWLIVEGGLGVDGVTDDEHLDPVDVGLYPLIGLSAAAFVRPMAYVSAGLQLHYGFFFPHAEEPEVGVGASGFFVISAAARGHYAFGRFEPYVGVGLGYAQTHSIAHTRRSPDGMLTLHALAVDLSVGLSIRVLDRLVVGPYARFVFGLWASGCQSFASWPHDVGEDGCADIEPLYGHELPRLPHLWTVGASASYWLL